MLHFFNVISGHYDIDISNRLIFCKDRNTGYNLSCTLSCTVALPDLFFYWPK